ncbi:MAG: hypothetical protein Q9M91_04455 [Candidatus Dojkabacteria bacterium]|nr:hypothetical protein [Candidatus Dojkabacteria bacterium]
MQIWGLGLKRMNLVLERMLKNDYITEVEFRSAIEEELFIKENINLLKSPTFSMMVNDEVNEIRKELEIDLSTELKVYTTYDYSVHSEILTFLDNQMKELEQKGANNSAVIITDNNGALITMIGSVDF